MGLFGFVKDAGRDILAGPNKIYRGPGEPAPAEHG